MTPLSFFTRITSNKLPLYRYGTAAAVALTLGAGSGVFSRPMGTLVHASNHSDENGPCPKLSPHRFQSCLVTSVQPDSEGSNSKLITMKMMPSSNQFPQTSFILLKTVVDGREELRPYTPIKFDYEKNEVQLLVKQMPQGRVSTFLTNQLHSGDTLLVAGPIKSLAYTPSPNLERTVVAFAAGSGITPIYQLVSSILADQKDKTQVKLYYSSKTVKHVLLRKELEDLVKKHPNKLHVEYFMDSNKITAPENLSKVKEVLHQVKHQANDEAPSFVPVVVCGPKGFEEAIAGAKASEFNNRMVGFFMKTIGRFKEGGPDNTPGSRGQGAVGGLLKECGFREKDVFKF